MCNTSLSFYPDMESVTVKGCVWVDTEYIEFFLKDLAYRVVY